MILKTFTHDRGDSGCWNFYDNIESASCYYNANTEHFCVDVMFRGSIVKTTIELTEPAYLCNDKGQTIEKLYPKALKYSSN